MSVTATNLIQGPATLYRGAFGALEPADFSTPIDSAVWRDLGGTQDGISFSIESEWSPLTVDQLVDEAGVTRVSRKVSIKTSLAEATLQNLALATANAAPVDGVLEPSMGVESFLPEYSAIMLEGIAPGGVRRRVFIRRSVSSDSVESSYKKDGQTLVPVTFAGYYVSPTIRPFRIVDEDEA